MTNRNDGRSRRGDIGRREFLKAAGATGLTVGLAGCSTIRGADVDGRTVQWYANADAAGAADEIRQALWNAGLPQDIYVDITAGPSNSDARKQQLQRWLAANLENPDLMLTDSGWTIPFIVRQQLLNFTQSEAIPDRLVKMVENQYFEASVRTAKHPGTGDLYGMPLFPDFPTMQYRKDLVEEAGYNPSQENWATESMHWKRFSRITEEVVERNDLDTGFTFQASAYEGLPCCDFNEFMSSWGGAYFGGRDNLFGPIGERPVTVARENVVDSIRMIRTFMRGQADPHSLPGYAGNIAPRAVISWTEETSRAPFANGNAAMHRNWPYAIPLTIEEADWATPDTYGVMPIPYATTERKSPYQNIGGPVAALGGWHMAVNPNTDTMGPSVRVLEAMAQESFKFELFEIMGWIPPEPQLLDSRRAKKVPIIGNYIEQLRVAGENAIPRPVTVVWPQQSTKIAQLVNDAYAGSIAPEPAMNRLQSQLQEIERYND